MIYRWAFFFVVSIAPTEDLIGIGALPACLQSTHRFELLESFGGLKVSRPVLEFEHKTVYARTFIYH